jgi:hypothetical protein
MTSGSRTRGQAAVPGVHSVLAHDTRLFSRISLARRARHESRGRHAPVLARTGVGADIEGVHDRSNQQSAETSTRLQLEPSRGRCGQSDSYSIPVPLAPTSPTSIVVRLIVAASSRRRLCRAGSR